MPSPVLHTQAKRYTKNIPQIEPGYTVRVHERIREGEKERVQIFEGLVIGVHNGHTKADASFTVRRIASGVGVERVFPMHSPLLEKIEVKKVAKVRRAKLNFLRGRQGKAARMSERFTSAEEFAIAVSAPAPAAEEVAEASEEKVEEKKETVQAAA
jgi:large subunit ribosomal protein L19